LARNTHQGFTLIELMITVAIIGIVSALALPAYRGYVETSNMTKVNAAWENAVRVIRNEMQKNKTRVSIGLPSSLPGSDKGWVEIIDPQGRFEAPGGGPQYVYYGQQNISNPAESGAILIKSVANGDVQIRRPAYLELEQKYQQVNVSGVSQIGN
jgi:prepilin-type N-terminal cleavage/methylation domain-containing protein